MSLGKRQMTTLGKKRCRIEETLGDEFGKC